MNTIAAASNYSTLTCRRKAAMIVQMMVGDGSSLSLDQLPEALQLLLTRELGAIRLVDRTTVSAVAAEFVAELEAIGLSAAGTHDGAVVTLADHLSPTLAEKLRNQLASVRNGDHWPIIIDLSVERIVTIMVAESVEVCAITLSKLPIRKAAEVLSKTPGDRARRVAYAMAQTGNISPGSVRRIGASLAQDYGQSKRLTFERAPVQRLGAILNSTPTATSEDVLAGLVDDDLTSAGNVRKAILTFKDIATRVKPTDIPNCMRSVDGEVLTVAIASALAGDEALVASAEFILGSVSQRMATQMREDTQERGRIKKTDAEAAMTAITAAIRGMVDGGIITLIDLDEETEGETV